MLNVPGKKEADGLELTRESMRDVFESLADPIFVTDPKGNVILSNSTTALTLGISLDQLIGSNLRDLVSKGYYNRSYALEAAQKKCPVGGLIRTKLNLTYFTNSTPILDDKNEVKLVLTTGKFLGLDGKYTDNRSNLPVNSQYAGKNTVYYWMADAVIAESKAMRQVLLKACRVAQTDTTVLITGETGTGKEVIARYIHNYSKRAKEAFITVNCAALPENLVESELFGYEKGAFTGAKPEGKAGLFECAHKGTLFLDEIGELPVYLQGKLLRVLETREVRRVGSNKAVQVDVRVIAATNKDLEEMVRKGSFRSDLYYRLSVFPIKLPALRERPEDIMALSFNFLDEFNKKYGTSFELTHHDLQSLLTYDWPGNVRELKNTIERMVINSSIGEAPHVQTALKMDDSQFPVYKVFKTLGLKGTLKEVLQQVEELYIKYILEECAGKKGKAAARLGIYRTVLYRKLKAYEKKYSGTGGGQGNG
ncbi:sigma-54 interaction domain-containing protein [Moorella sulfitireducens]|uniref:sigma-54 interaction domain-containing protein n=1 Tax=Neomoorella sulfitireducens TaxID=2972948 RepID=UPI0021ABFAD1|nr:sigma 54-interacting transcriptional regulator [Moorella sulfitireducens]